MSAQYERSFEVRVTLFANDGLFDVKAAQPLVFWTNWAMETLASQAHNLLYGTSVTPAQIGFDDIKIYYENGVRVKDIRHIQQNACLVVGTGDFVGFRYKDTKKHGVSNWNATQLESFLTGLMNANHQDEARQLTEPNRADTAMVDSLQNLESFLSTEHDIWVAQQQSKGIVLAPEVINPPRPNRRDNCSAGTDSDSSTPQLMYPSVLEWVEDNCITPRSSFSINDTGFNSGSDATSAGYYSDELSEIKTEMKSAAMSPEVVLKTFKEQRAEVSPKKEQKKSRETLNKVVKNVTLPRMDLAKTVDKRKKTSKLAKTASDASSGRVSKSGAKDRTADKLWRLRVSDQLNELKDSIPQLAEEKKRSTKAAIFSSAKEYISSITEENKKLEQEIAKKKSELMAHGRANTFATNTGVIIVEQRLDMLEQGPVVVYADHHWKLMTGHVTPEGKRMMELCGTDNNPFMYSACKVMNKTLFDSRELHWSGVMLCLRSDGVIMGCNATIEPVKLDQEAAGDDEATSEMIVPDIVRSVILTKDWYEFNISDSIGSDLSPQIIKSSDSDRRTTNSRVKMEKPVNKIAVRC